MMQKLTAADAEARSADPVAENVERLKELFPEAFTEGKIDFEVLRQVLGGAVDEREEKYGLNWHGKHRARQIALTPSAGTLRPAPEESVDWDTTRNLFIEGDNLEVLKLLQKGFAGKVKLIYIDPPYNTGKDFIYPDDFTDSISNYLEVTGQLADNGRISSNSETSGRYHTDWLNMIYPRLRLARNLLSEQGLIFVSIDDTEVGHLRVVCDDVFGDECFAGCITRATGTPTGGGNSTLVNEIDYLLVYSRHPGVTIEGVPFSDADEAIYDKEDEGGRYLTRSLRRTGGEDRREDRPTMYYPLRAPDGSEIFPVAPGGYESRWICGLDRFKEMEKAGLIEWQRVMREGFSVWHPYQKFYLEGRRKQPSNLWSGLEGNKKATRDLKALFGGEKVFSFPKPVGLIRHILQLAATETDAIVMDFFAGSGTTGHAVWMQNAVDAGSRRYILVQLPEPISEENREQTSAAQLCDKIDRPRNIAELTKMRLRRAAASVRGPQPNLNVDLGFRVFKLDSSNIRAWDPDRENLPLTLESAVENIKPDRSEQDVLFELLLKRGLDLTIPIEQREIAGKTVHSIGAGTMLVCLNPRISRDDVEPLTAGMIAWHAELAPAGETQVIFLDSAFADDVAKSNLAAILEQHGLKHVRSL